MMKDHKKVAEDIRFCSEHIVGVTCEGCDKDEEETCCLFSIHGDLLRQAADAIEALYAEVEKWQDVAYQDSLEQEKMQERIWELEALKEAHIEPSYGEWLTVEVNPLDRMHNPIYECTCSRCHKEYTFATIPNYCTNCGAEMEVQE